MVDLRIFTLYQMAGSRAIFIAELGYFIEIAVVLQVRSLSKKNTSRECRDKVDSFGTIDLPEDEQTV